MGRPLDGAVRAANALAAAAAQLKMSHQYPASVRPKCHRPSCIARIPRRIYPLNKWRTAEATPGAVSPPDRLQSSACTLLPPIATKGDLDDLIDNRCSTSSKQLIDHPLLSLSQIGDDSKQRTHCGLTYVPLV